MSERCGGMAVRVMWMFSQAESTTHMAFHTISVMARAGAVSTVIVTSTYLEDAVVPADDVTDGDAAIYSGLTDSRTPLGRTSRAPASGGGAKLETTSPPPRTSVKEAR